MAMGSLATIDTQAAPGNRVSNVVTKDPITGQYIQLPTSSVSSDMLSGVLAWDATSPNTPANQEVSLTIMDNGTPKPVIVRRLP